MKAGLRYLVDLIDYMPFDIVHVFVCMIVQCVSS